MPRPAAAVPSRSGTAVREPAALWQPVWERLQAARWLPVASVVPVVLAVAAELGHLAAAYVEWLESATRGGYHAAAGALLGLVAAAATRAGWGRAARRAAAVVALAGPALWLVGAPLTVSPYDVVPVPAAAGVAGCEVLLAALLLGANPGR